MHSSTLTRCGRAKHKALFHKNRFTPYDCPDSQSAVTGPNPSLPDSPIHLPSSLPLPPTSSVLCRPPDTSPSGFSSTAPCRPSSQIKRRGRPPRLHPYVLKKPWSVQFNFVLTSPQGLTSDLAWEYFCVYILLVLQIFITTDDVINKLRNVWSPLSCFIH